MSSSQTYETKLNLPQTPKMFLRIWTKTEMSSANFLPRSRPDFLGDLMDAVSEYYCEVGSPNPLYRPPC